MSKRMLLEKWNIKKKSRKIIEKIWKLEFHMNMKYFFPEFQSKVKKLIKVAVHGKNSFNKVEKTFNFEILI